MKNKASFTLIELLVVIAVLAGFMALLVPNFMEIRKKARDMRRKSDMRGIQKALELYRQSQTTASYPGNLPTVCTSLTDGSGAVYMQKIPQDPLTKCGSNAVGYYYKRDTIDTSQYVMYGCLENINDADGSGCPADFQALTTAACTTSKCYQLTQP